MTYPSVEAAIAAAYSETPLRAIDPEAMASRVTTERPGPRAPTVRRTGSEGGYVLREPTAAVERALVRVVVEELPGLCRALVIAYALRVPERAVLRSWRAQGGSIGDRAARSLRENGLEWVRVRLVEREILAA